MSVEFGDKARALRALIAMALLVGLGVILVNKERVDAEERALAVRTLNQMLWSMSELNFESQRLINALTVERAGLGSRDETQLRYDVLWSRLGVARIRPYGAETGINEVIDQFEAFLLRHENAVFSTAPIPATELQAMTEELSALTIRARQLWSNNFGTQNPARRVLSGVEDPGRATTMLLAMALISLLTLYVTAEVYFASYGLARERKLRLAAAEASEAKSRFLANVSHEIRTPLNGILGMTSELGETPLNADQKKCLDVIVQSGNVLLSTINDVLDLSRIEAGRLDIGHAPFDLPQVIAASCALYESRAREKGLTLDLDIADDVPRRILGDGMRLRQVMHNLVSNAVKFTETGGVKIRVRLVTHQGRPMVEITVSDSGPGIAEDARARIFEPFGQADSSITRRHGGTGLGLAISRQLCKAMNGHLALDTRAGVGATFFCRVPLEIAPAEDHPVSRGEEEPVPQMAGLHVLIVDDNATNRLILGRFLKHSEASLAFVESGTEAVAACARSQPDLILMDVQMPGMDGVEATRRIRAVQGDHARALIIGVTANALSHQIESYLSAGMDAVLPKPVSKQALFRLIHRLGHDRAA